MESNENPLDGLVVFFKALADENRLKIVGLLAQRALSTEQLAAILDLKPATVSHHLNKLAQAGLAQAHTESHYKVYELQAGALHAMAKRLLAEETLPEAASDVDVDAYDRKVVADFSRRDGRLKEIPAQRKKREAVLRRILEEFRPAKHYSEKQVNDIIGRFHEDTATLRRELVGYGGSSAKRVFTGERNDRPDRSRKTCQVCGDATMESNETAQTELVMFFKTLCDESRLKMVGVLAQQAWSLARRPA